MHVEYEYVLLDITEEGIATITLHRPKALNALCSEVNRDLMSAVKEVLANPSVRVLILTGSPRAFAAGADIKEMLEITPRQAGEAGRLIKDINELLESMPIPTIAAVGGIAFGGGFEVALSCDFRIGGPHTKFALPEVGLGIIPGANGMIRVAQIVGLSKAKELSMLGTVVPGEEAYHLGLLNWFVKADPELDAAAAAQSEYDAIYGKAVEIARQLCTKPAKALESVKKVIYDTVNVNAQQGKLRETAEFSLLFNTHDQKEGMAAFAEKRPPKYTNN